MCQITMTMVNGTAYVLGFHFVECYYLLLHIENVFQLANQFVVVPWFGYEVGGTVLQSFTARLMSA